MKKISVFYLIIVISTSFSCLSRKNIEKNENATYAISLPHLNILFRGYPNQVRIATSGYSSDEIIPKCSGCDSFTKSGNLWIAKVSSAEKVKISIFKEEKELAYQDFRVFPLPKAQPYFQNKTYNDTWVDGDLIREGIKLEAKLPSPFLDLKYTVISFSMTIAKGGKIIELGNVDDDDLTEEMLNEIKELKEGDKVYFEYILIAGPDGKSFPVGGLSFKLMS